jgi:hypothetical protein
MEMVSGKRIAEIPIDMKDNMLTIRNKDKAFIHG